MTPTLKTIPNFRDCGGLVTVDGYHLRWGRVYRSGTLDDARVDDRRTLRTLGLKTIVDLRASEKRRDPRCRSMERDRCHPIAAPHFEYFQRIRRSTDM